MAIETGIISSPVELKELSSQIKHDYSAHSVFYMGRAATALLYAYSAVKKLKPAVKNPEIIMPGLSCATPSNTALICGLKPRYADISAKTALSSFNDIKKKYTSKTVAVLYIHLYGNTGELDELKEWCTKKNIFLIEDVAQSLGGLLPGGKLSGSIGDFTIFSFNKTKILECGGGALTAKTKPLADAVKGVIKEKKFKENKDKNFLSQLSLSYRNLHHSLVALKRANPEVNISEGFLKLRGNYTDLFFRKDINGHTLANDFELLNQKLAARKAKAEIYRRAVENIESLSLLEGWERSGCCWRFSFLVNKPAKLVDFSEAVRKDGFHLSNLYWPVNQFFNPSDDCPIADKVARRIINLWVDDSVSEEWVRNCAASVKAHAHLLK